MTDKADKTLKEFLDGKSSVARGYAALGDVQPPAALDRAILTAARTAVAHEDDATVVRVRRWHRWSVPAALAATVVIAVPLVVQVVGLRIDEQQPPLQSRTALDERDADTRLQPGRDETATRADIADLETEHRRNRVGSAPAQSGAPAAPAAPVDDQRLEQSARQTAAAAARSTLEQAVAQTPAALEPVAVTGYAPPPAMAQPAVPEAAADAAAPVAGTGDTLAMKTTAPASAGANGSMAARMFADSEARPDYLAAPRFLERIATAYRDGRTQAARRELGEFLLMYPEARLPDDFPLARSEAIPPQRRIVREADEWLRGIATLHAQGRIDAARQELARFHERYPDYELPAWFPLTREDAAPIER